MELAEKTGATIYTSHLAPVQYPHHAARDQDLVSLDGAHIRHSPDPRGAPLALFTGDLLFVGDVGTDSCGRRSDEPRRAAV